MVKSFACGHSSDGRASAFQAECRGFESRCSLHIGHLKCPICFEIYEPEDVGGDKNIGNYFYFFGNRNLHLRWYPSFTYESTIDGIFVLFLAGWLCIGDHIWTFAVHYRMVSVHFRRRHFDFCHGEVSKNSARHRRIFFLS